MKINRKNIISFCLFSALFSAVFLFFARSELKTGSAVLGPENSSGRLDSFLSDSLLDKETKNKTDWFANIIPSAQAASPFDALNNRKLTIYGGVITIVNGNDNATHYLEIGQVSAADNNSIGLASTGQLYIIPNEKDLYAAARFIGWTDTSGDGRDRVYLSLTDDLRIQEAGTGDTMSLGNAGRDIRSSGNIYIRPNDSTAISRFIGVSGQTTQNLFLFEGKDVNTGGGTLRVNNNLEAVNYGSETDAIFAAANNSDGAAVSALQTGTGYAGYFSGKVRAESNSGNPALSVIQTGIGYAGSFTHLAGGYAGYFSGKVGVFGGNLDIGTAGDPRQICWNNDCRSNWPTGGSVWQQSGDNIYYKPNENWNYSVGIGTNNPTHTLELGGSDLYSRKAEIAFNSKVDWTPGMSFWG